MTRATEFGKKSLSESDGGQNREEGTPHLLSCRFIPGTAKTKTAQKYFQPD